MPMAKAQGTLLAVFAHPDDEGYSIGGTLAKYAAEGHDVHLVSATRGEAGEIADTTLATPSNLPFVRERELRCACQAYGIHPPQFLDYIDGQLAVVHQGQAVGKVVRLIRELRPEVLVTFGPDGIYGHYDHIAVHRWTTIAAELAADANCFPDALAGACQPHQVNKLYYHVLTEEQVRAISPDQPAAVMMDGVPFPMVGCARDEITTVIDISEHLEAKLRGLRCHATQVPQGSPEDQLQEMRSNPLFRQEDFVLARSTVGRPEGLEVDLFAGLRDWGA